MNTTPLTAHPDLVALVLSKFLVRGSITPNPRILEDAEHGEIIRFYIVTPTNSYVRQVLKGELEKRELPYTFVRVEFSAGSGTYADFKVKA
jgi:hypothetical protein